MGSSPLTYQHLLLELFLLFLAVETRGLVQPGEAPAPAPTPASQAASFLVISSCADAAYPSLCVRSLSSSQLTANSTSADLARVAVSASLSSAHGAVAFLSRLLASSSPAPGALKDCVEQLADSADLLGKTERELRQLRRETFQGQLDDALTWASAAMTNQNTCVEGLQDGDSSGEAAAVAAGTMEAVVKRVSRVSQYTSNALYLINRLASTRGL